MTRLRASTMRDYHTIKVPRPVPEPIDIAERFHHPAGDLESSLSSSPRVEKARNRLSGDQYGQVAPSVPGSWRAEKSERRRTQRALLPFGDEATKAIELPSGDTAKSAGSWENVAPSGAVSKNRSRPIPLPQVVTTRSPRRASRAWRRRAGCWPPIAVGRHRERGGTAVVSARRSRSVLRSCARSRVAAYRWRGSFARQRSMSHCNWAGAREFRPVICGASSVMMADSVCTGVSR